MYQLERLNRFHKVHDLYYETALSEIKNGKKQSHWIWFIFPQIKGLGKTETSQYYAIENREEALAFLSDAVLGNHIREISSVLLKNKSSNPIEIMGIPDNLKLCSSMTLFYNVSGEKVFFDVLEKYYSGQQDKRTLKILNM